MALQHLKNDVSRLGGCYDELFALLEERAKQHHSQREIYQEDYLVRHGPWRPSSDDSSYDDIPPIIHRIDRKNPQPEEAKRWLRQADADLESCSRDTDSFEWLCFKCHQVNSIKYMYL